MFKVIIGLDQFREAVKNNWIDENTVFLYTNRIDREHSSQLVLRAIDKHFSSKEIAALVDFLATERYECIRDFDIYSGRNDNYAEYSKKSFIEAQIAAGRMSSHAEKVWNIIEFLMDL